MEFGGEGALVMDQAESGGDGRGGQDAHQNCPANPKGQEHQHHQKAQNAHQGDRMAEIAKTNQCSRRSRPPGRRTRDQSR